jgi:hypothetical protein
MDRRKRIALAGARLGSVAIASAAPTCRSPNRMPDVGTQVPISDTYVPITSRIGGDRRVSAAGGTAPRPPW